MLGECGTSGLNPVLGLAAFYATAEDCGSGSYAGLDPWNPMMDDVVEVPVLRAVPWKMKSIAGVLRIFSRTTAMMPTMMTKPTTGAIMTAVLVVESVTCVSVRRGTASKRYRT